MIVIDPRYASLCHLLVNSAEGSGATAFPGEPCVSPFLPFIGYGRLVGGSCFLCKIGIRIVPKLGEVHMSKALKLGLQQVDPAL